MASGWFQGNVGDQIVKQPLGGSYEPSQTRVDPFKIIGDCFRIGVATLPTETYYRYIYVCMHACMHACMYVCMYVYVCVCVCMCVCMYV